MTAVGEVEDDEPSRLTGALASKPPPDADFVLNPESAFDTYQFGRGICCRSIASIRGFADEGLEQADRADRPGLENFDEEPLGGVGFSSPTRSVSVHRLAVDLDQDRPAQSMG